MNQLNELIENKEIFFRYLSERLPVFTGANVFLRDIQYGIKFFFEKKNIKLKYPNAEALALEFTSALTDKNELIKYNHYTWKVNFEFKEMIVPETVVEETTEATE